MDQGDKFKVEVELTGPYPGWRNLHFYLIKFGKTIWKSTVLKKILHWQIICQYRFQKTKINSG